MLPHRAPGRIRGTDEDSPSSFLCRLLSSWPSGYYFLNRHDDYDQARTAEVVGPDGIMRAFTNAGIAFRFLRVVSLDYTKAMGACLSIAPSRLHSS